MPSITKRAKACSRKTTPTAISIAPAPRTAGEAESILQPVIERGIQPATTPGATMRNRALPRAARALRLGWGAVTRERLDQRSQPLWLVLRDERVGILDLLEPGAADGRHQALRERELEEAVLHRPGQQRRAIEIPQPLGGLKGVLGIYPAQHLDRVAADIAIGQERVDPLAQWGAVQVALDQPAVGDRQPPHRSQTH